ncbi:unnamed protein product [Ostreobium quekettii]|uniref:Uncharacterized protein n=1 Tax=Ostreobium quekettii TaxID=121088 RepID=A0A8S1JCH8_9CHLO|nr:unnamed protein product [Ostreobium quekettii]
MSETLFESAQAILTGFDTALSRQWREEDRKWRREDLEWRKVEQGQIGLETDFMTDGRKWRAQDMEQRVLDNARFVWSRAVEKNRREVEERAEQLKGISNLAALIGGFALIAFLEFGVDDDTPVGLVVGFGLTTALTVGLMVNAMVTTSLMHASILKTGKNFVSEEDEAEFIFRCRQFARDYRIGDRPPAPARTFDAHWSQRAEGEWRRAFFMFSAGIPLFLLNLALAGWIKFSHHRDNNLTAILISVVMVVSCITLLLSHRQWGRHLVARRDDLVQVAARAPIDPASLPFDWHLKPQPPAPRFQRVVAVSRSLNSGDGSQSLPATPFTSSLGEAATMQLTGRPVGQTPLTSTSRALAAGNGRSVARSLSPSAPAHPAPTAPAAAKSTWSRPVRQLGRSLSSAELILGEFRKRIGPSDPRMGGRPPSRQLSLSRMAQAMVGGIGAGLPMAKGPSKEAAGRV